MLNKFIEGVNEEIPRLGGYKFESKNIADVSYFLLHIIDCAHEPVVQLISFFLSLEYMFAK